MGQTLYVETLILSLPLESSCGFESACSETSVTGSNLINQWWSFSQDICHFMVIFITYISNCVLEIKEFESESLY